MNFGQAIEAIKEGKRAARSGWNGKGMWIALSPGSLIEAKYANDRHAAKHRAVEVDAENEKNPEGLKQIRLQPHIDMRSDDGSMVIGWIASQTDMLSEDWHVIEAA